MPTKLKVSVLVSDLVKKMDDLETRINLMPKPSIYTSNNSTIYTSSSTADNNEFARIIAYYTYPFKNPSWLQDYGVTPVEEPMLEFRGGATADDHMEHLTEIIHHFLWQYPTSTISIFPNKDENNVIVGYRVGVYLSDVKVGSANSEYSWITLPDGTEGTFSFLPIVCSYSPRNTLDTLPE